MGFEPIEFPVSERKKNPPTISPGVRRTVWLISAIVAIALSGVAQTVALVKGCRAEDVGVSAKADSAAVEQKVTELGVAVRGADIELASRNPPQVGSLNAVVMRLLILEKLCLSSAGPAAVKTYRAKKKEQPELKVIEVPEGELPTGGL